MKAKVKEEKLRYDSHIDDARIARRRRVWSPTETLSLQKGIAKYGVGYWSKILADPTLLFSARTAVDLKDKYRQMERKREKSEKSFSITAITDIEQEEKKQDSRLARISPKTERRRESLEKARSIEPRTEQIDKLKGPGHKTQNKHSMTRLSAADDLVIVRDIRHLKAQSNLACLLYMAGVGEKWVSFDKLPVELLPAVQKYTEELRQRLQAAEEVECFLYALEQESHRGYSLESLQITSNSEKEELELPHVDLFKATEELPFETQADANLLPSKSSPSSSPTKVSPFILVGPKQTRSSSPQKQQQDYAKQVDHKRQRLVSALERARNDNKRTCIIC